MASPQHTKKFAPVLAQISTWTSIWISVLFLALSSSSLRAAQAHSGETTTLAIFQDRHSAPISPELFSALQSALRADLAADDPELQPLRQYSSDVQILPADQVVPGLVVTNSITIYLHGDCNPLLISMPQFNPRSVGTLGWVEQHDGQIEPFVHADCRHIAQFLQPEMRGKSADQRNQIQAQAIARVVLHEWIHIATQSPHHAKEGIARAQFTRADLLSKPDAKALIQSPNPTPTSSEPFAGK
jgi:hypothetical protein